MTEIYDLAVVGSGFAGTLLAMIARRLGRSVILIEKGQHPRFAIGESSTPLSNLLLEELAQRYDLAALKPLTKWGSWQKAHPELACGLKRGFTFYHHDLHSPETQRSSDTELLVAASPHGEIADTHWYRADFDEFFVHEAQKLGVPFVDQVSLEKFNEVDDLVHLRGRRLGRDVTYRTRFVVDATGPSGFLHRVLCLGNLGLPEYPKTQALYSHFSHVRRSPTYNKNAANQIPPYPPEQAAIHHLFDGGWIWVLHFNNGITSAGVAATDHAAERFGLSHGEAAWHRLLANIPQLASQFAASKPVQPFSYTPRLSFRSSAIAGDRWAMLPSAAGFVDPLLSTGLPLTLLGVTRLGEILEHRWPQPELSANLAAYAKKTEDELLATSRLVAALYANLHNFPVFRSLALLYFAAASFAETARRLNRPDLAQSFLLHDRPGFGEASKRLLARAASGIAQIDAAAFATEVRRMIQPIDVAGLCKDPSPAWYPVRAEDLIQGAGKLGATEAEIGRLLERSGFHEPDRSSAERRSAKPRALGGIHI